MVQRVCTPGTRAQDCKQVRLHATPTECVYTRAAEPGGVLGDQRLGEVTLTDLAALPDDVARLREKLRTHWTRHGQAGESFEDFLPGTAAALLELPVRPSVRAAALRGSPRGRS
ncbi:hypothetical protein [Microtetraspora malaysiensis]|uniref:hypothetical protein n=1 Tax=Microtetraspora malaysiensis TaxID=161358 RepID=UPI003D927E92